MPQIPAYPAKTVPSNGDLLVIHDSVAGNTKNITRGNLLSGAPLPNNTVTTAAMADGAVTPVKRSGGFFIGSISGATVGTTGNKSVTGVGFTPKLVKFAVLFTAATGNTNYANGSMTNAAQYYTAMSASTSGSVTSRTSATNACIGWVTGGSSTPSLLASYVSMDADGFTINVSAASNAFAIAYEAYA